MAKIKREFTAVYKKDTNWYVGWVEEIPGVNTQGKTLKETRENLKDALRLILETNKTLNKAVNEKDKLIRESFAVSL